MSELKPAIFLDRDGVINQNRADYVKSWEEYTFLPDVFEPLKRLAESEYLIVVVSNQSPIGRGLVPQAAVEAINARMEAEIRAWGGRLDGVYYCPHAPEDNCDCRKPKPGMFFQAAAELNIDLASSYFVGDALSDVEAAFNAGCEPVFVLTGRGPEQLPLLRQRDNAADVAVVANLAAAVALILDNQGVPS